MGKGYDEWRAEAHDTYLVSDVNIFELDDKGVGQTLKATHCDAAPGVLSRANDCDVQVSRAGMVLL